MQFLIDTHVLIWYLNGDPSLPEKYIELMYNPPNKLMISLVSIWELTIKMSLNKIQFEKPPKEIEKYISSKDYEVLNLKFDHFNTLNTLPHHHNDPFDRLLISQAITENLTIISADRHFAAYPANVIW
jgi:PIN domain nuclease of toxin-antitoxin system